MRYSLVALLVILTGCAGSPPKPAAVNGEYRPVNRAAAPQEAPQPAAFVETETIQPKVFSGTRKTVAFGEQTSFDFYFQGDLVEALNALNTQNPEIKTLPFKGDQAQIRVAIAMKDATIDEILSALGVLAGERADVVLKETQEGRQVFIRFKGGLI